MQRNSQVYDSLERPKLIFHFKQLSQEQVDIDMIRRNFQKNMVNLPMHMAIEHDDSMNKSSKPLIGAN